MAKTKISEFSATPANNTDIDSINIAEGCSPSGINDAIRELMAQLKDFQTGAVGDSFNGPVGTSTAAAGAFTTLSATGAITSTLATGSAPLVIASTTKVANLNVDLLDGADWAAPAALGSTTPAAVSATTLSASSTLSVTGAGSIQGLTVGRGAGAVSTNTAVGASALAANTSGLANVGVGYLALTANTTGALNVAVGRNSLIANTTADGNTALGDLTLTSNTTGASNVAVGRQALQANTTASNNTAVGYQAGYSNTTGQFNTFIGVASGYTNTTSNANTYIGRYAGNVATGGSNTFVGMSSGDAVTTGNNNTILGRYTGNAGGLDIRTSSNYIVLSDGDGNPRASCTTAGAWYFYNTGGAGSDVVNAYSGAAAGTGRSLYTGWYDATSPTAGTLSFNVTTNGNVTNTNNSYGAISDIKLKENIVDVTPKLADLMQVRVVNYNFKEGQTHKQIGVIAQELEQVFPAMVDEVSDTDIDGNDLGTTTKQVKYSVFVPMLIKAMQEQQAIIESLKARLDAANL